MAITVVDYNAGNLTSVMNALKYIGADAKVSRDPDEIAKATRLICPGVGAAASAMETLTRTGIGDAIKAVVKAGNPVLGICIGCQIILEESEEDGGVKTLGLIPGRAVRFKDEPGLKIPHMGWNQVNFTRAFEAVATSTTCIPTTRRSRQNIPLPRRPTAHRPLRDSWVRIT